MEYEIKGDTLPVVLIHLNDNEKLITASGAMSWMTPDMEMETQSGGFMKAIGRLFSGDSLWQNIYLSHGANTIACASRFPGRIIAFLVNEDEPLILKKSAFLASTENVAMTAEVQGKASTGLFGGEGFVMERLSGFGTCWANFAGDITEYQLEAGQQIIVDSGHLAAMSASCEMDIRSVQGVKNKLLGGHGFFHTVITGPGKVLLQSMPLAKLADALLPYMPVHSGSDEDN
jgi:uncharacterized protein (TIGR00266 family)